MHVRRLLAAHTVFMCHFAVGKEHQGVAGQFYASKVLLFLLICFLLTLVSAVKFIHYCKNAVRCSVTGVGRNKTLWRLCKGFHFTDWQF